MAEQELLNRGAVHITTARAVLDGTTYAVRNISAVQLVKTQDKGLAGGIALIVLGIAAGVIGFVMDTMLGAGCGALLALAGCLLALRKEQWTLWLQTNAGRVAGVVTNDGDLAARAKVALDQAIVNA